MCRCMTKEQRSAESKCFWQNDWSRPEGSRMCVMCLCILARAFVHVFVSETQVGRVRTLAGFSGFWLGVG